MGGQTNRANESELDPVKKPIVQTKETIVENY